jgi:hypothetical protein
MDALVLLFVFIFALLVLSTVGVAIAALLWGVDSRVSSDRSH